MRDGLLATVADPGVKSGHGPSHRVLLYSFPPSTKNLLCKSVEYTNLVPIEPNGTVVWPLIERRPPKRVKSE